MNTLNGNFIERVIPNIKNATLNLLIGDQLATMNLADFQAAIAPSYTSSKGLKMKDNLPLDGTLNNVVDSSDVVTISPLQLSTEAVGLSRTVNLSAGATTPRLFNVVYTINNSGAQTGTLTGYFLNATETALNGITHNLMDLQVGGTSKFLVTNAGLVTFVRGVIGTIQNNAINNFNNTVTMFTLGATSTMYGGTLLQLSGTTSSFPAIKRNGAGIDFRLADDSDYCQILSLASVSTTFVKGFTYGLFGTVGGPAATAILQADSTTKGFLPPRMTTAQVNAIVTPAEGLQVYNTTINHMCFYMSGAWQKINHSPM